MDHTLFGDHSASARAPLPTCFEEFVRWFRRNCTTHVADLPPSNHDPADDECSLCLERKRDVYALTRSCLSGRYSCEGHVCNCDSAKGSYFPCCSHCLAHALWTRTTDFLKKEGRYRARCPYCRAEFCPEDVVLLKFSSTGQIPRQRTPPRVRARTPPRSSKRT